MTEYENERAFLHDISNTLTKVQGKAMILQVKIDSLSKDELKEQLQVLNDHITNLGKSLASRKKQITES